MIISNNNKLRDYYLKYNPFSSSYESLSNDVIIFKNQKKKIEKNLSWFQSNSEHSILNKIENLNIKKDGLKLKIKKIENQLNDKIKDQEKIRKSIKTRLNPFNLISSSQTNFRKRYKVLDGNIDFLQKKYDSNFNELKELENTIVKTEMELDLITNYDINENKANIKRLNEKIDLYESELKEIIFSKDKLDKSLEPILDEMIKTENKISLCEKKMYDANIYIQRLNNAYNSYERATIHSSCENNFGIGSPKKVIHIEKSKLKKFQRDLKKIERRAYQIKKKASLDINEIIVDGNNLCYEGNEFVGLTPLVEITNILIKKYKVLLIFDSDIRSIMNSDNQKIKSKFNEDVKVHIVASRQKADSTILDLASNQQNTYILSNDTYADYIDKEVVQNNRIIKHEMVNNLVLINDLDIKIRW